MGVRTGLVHYHYSSPSWPRSLVLYLDYRDTFENILDFLCSNISYKPHCSIRLTNHSSCISLRWHSPPEGLPLSSESANWSLTVSGLWSSTAGVKNASWDQGSLFLLGRPRSITPTQSELRGYGITSSFSPSMLTLLQQPQSLHCRHQDQAANLWRKLEKQHPTYSCPPLFDSCCFWIQLSNKEPK